MSFEVDYTPNFAKSLKILAKRHRSIKTDLRELISTLEQTPLIGDELSPGIRKIRMAITSKGKGKSGGARVITYTVLATSMEGRVYLLDIYDKSDFVTVDVSILKEYIRDL